MSDMERKELNDFDDTYTDIINDILNNGEEQSNQRGKNIAKIGVYKELNILHLPIITKRVLRYKSCVVELLWMLRGEDNIKYLTEHGCKYWNKDADENGFIGLNYGLMCNWPNSKDASKPINQLKNVIDILSRPDRANSRNLDISLNKPDTNTRVNACVSAISFNVSAKRYLHIHVTQRSCDMSCGYPADVFTFALLAHLVCREVNMKRRAKNIDLMLQPGIMHHYIKNAHIYANNIDHDKAVLKNEKMRVAVMPKIQSEDKSLWQLEPSDIEIIGYDEVKKNQKKVRQKLNLNQRTSKEWKDTKLYV